MRLFLDATVSPPPASPTIAQHQHGITHIAVSSVGDLTAIGDVHMNVEVRRGSTVVWSKDMGTIDPKVRVTQKVRDLRFSADGTKLFVAAADYFWALDALTGDPLWSYVAPRYFAFLVISPLSIAVSETGYVAVSFDNGRVRMWSVDGVSMGQWRDVDVQNQIAFLPGGTRLVGCDGVALNLFDPFERRRVDRFRLSERVYGLAVSTASNLIAVRTLHDLLIMSSQSGEVLAKAPLGFGLPLVAFHPTEPLIALGEKFGVGLVGTDALPVRYIEIEDARVVSIAFTADGKSLAVGRSDGELRLYDLS